jgi:hypothetical protein
MDEASRVLMVQNKLPEMRSAMKSLEKQVARLTEQLAQQHPESTAEAA